MKNLTKILFVFIIYLLPLQAYQPEIYIELDDYYNQTYYVKATAITYVYDQYFNYTDNYQTAEASVTGIGTEGFDFVFSSGGIWGDIAYSIYRFDFSRDVGEPVLFSFDIDFRYCYHFFYDITLKYYVDADNIVTASWRRSNSSEEHFISNGFNLNYCAMVGLSYDLTCFDANIYLHNYITNENNEFEDYGHIFADNLAYESGVDIFTALKGTVHNFKSYTLPVGIENYLFRNWSTTSDKYLNPKNQQIINNDDINAFLYHTQPLTVTNNLEGGNSTDNFEITWQEVKPAQSHNYGFQYNAFNYQSPTNDQYTIKALPINSLRYGTSWDFFNWNTGSMYDTIRNIKVNAPVSFTANYKGHFRADNTSAYSSNSQQKTIRDNNGYYHTVYISMGIPWYTKSTTTNFGGEWTKEKELIIYNGVAKNPSLDFYGNNKVLSVYALVFATIY